MKYYRIRRIKDDNEASTDYLYTHLEEELTEEEKDSIKNIKNDTDKINDEIDEIKRLAVNDKLEDYYTYGSISNNIHLWYHYLIEYEEIIYDCLGLNYSESDNYKFKELMRKDKLHQYLESTIKQLKEVLKYFK